MDIFTYETFNVEHDLCELTVHQQSNNHFFYARNIAQAARQMILSTVASDRISSENYIRHRRVMSYIELCQTPKLLSVQIHSNEEARNSTDTATI